MKKEYRSGADLLADCQTREEKLERAVMALMSELNAYHWGVHGIILGSNLENPDFFCSCADAYRMGHEALKV